MSKFRPRTVILIFFSATLSCTSVEPIQTKAFSVKNVPEHVFKLKYAALKDTIVSLFNVENQLDDKILNKIFYNYILNGSTMVLTFQAETSRDTIFSREYFSKPTTSNDIFIHDFRESWPSKFYYSKNHALKYAADFIVKLYKVDDTSTKISIMAYNPEVINGISGYGAHGPVARYTPVLPTTIEEYTLLEFIASKLGDTTLLPIKLPDN
jgi:hypothetical protein